MMENLHLMFEMESILSEMSYRMLGAPRSHKKCTDMKIKFSTRDLEAAV